MSMHFFSVLSRVSLKKHPDWVKSQEPEPSENPYESRFFNCPFSSFKFRADTQSLCRLVEMTFALSLFQAGSL